MHFTGRARQQFAPEVFFLTPEERLDVIIHEERLLAFKPYCGPVDVVCFSESDKAGVAALLSRGLFAGWGVVLRRSWLWDAGGGPAWYVRDDMWPQAARLQPELRSWMVRTEAGTSDWLHEREWRVPCLSGELELDVSGVEAFLVSDENWEPHPATDVAVDPTSGRMCLAEMSPRMASEVPRWLWTGSEIVELDPLPRRERVVHIV